MFVPWIYLGPSITDADADADADADTYRTWTESRHRQDIVTTQTN